MAINTGVPLHQSISKIALLQVCCKLYRASLVLLHVQTLLEAILPPDAQMAANSRPLLPGTLAMVPQEALWASPALILSARHSAVRAAAMHTSLLSTVLEAAGAVAAPSVLQLSYTRYIHPQVCRQRKSLRS